MYLTIGNLPKDIRRKPSRQGQILLAYLPTTSLRHITNKASRRRMMSNLFHACMCVILQQLKEAGIDGVIMASGDGIKRRCHPIYAVYVGDYPEQVLVTTVYTGDSPVCDCPKAELGQYPCEYAYRDFERALSASKLVHTDQWASACANANIRPVQHPFWEDLPYANVFNSITPDILHQLYQGVIKHLIHWVTDICGAAEIDARVRRLPRNHCIRMFQKGITSLSRVSGTEHRQISAFLLGLVIDIHLPDGASNADLVTAVRSMLDFLYQAQYPIHSDLTLDAMDACLAKFHECKEIFVTLGIRDHFNLPKLHYLAHTTRPIRFFGTTDNYNTETTERLHIDFTKDAYRATNRKDEFAQMTKWLERREKVLYHSNYLAWQLSESSRNNTKSSSTTLNPPNPRSLLSHLECKYTIKMTLFPTVKSVSFEKLSTSYGATLFHTALVRFIGRFSYPNLTDAAFEEKLHSIILPFRSVPVYHKIRFINDELHGDETLDAIHANPGRLAPEGQIGGDARFDTALIRVREIDSDERCSPVDGLLCIGLTLDC